MITYEYPFSERIRTLLRLEDIFDKADYFVRKRTPREHHAALMAIFEIFEVAGRADLKMDLLQELKRQRQSLLNCRNEPGASEDILRGALYEIEQASAAILGMVGKIGQHLRENEWLMGIKSRAVIPGGVCEFDLPSYHYWRCLTTEKRRESLGGWLEPFLPLKAGIAIVLRLLRQSGEALHQVARGGLFQMTPSGSAPQMVRVSLKPDLPLVPEVSANKYVINIRFVHPDKGHHAGEQET
ncbi:MAG: cell division protein ZapD, partial [Candidatus Accumulibacter sp.]|nr:cell division protein ZapD [Accumulibacter sp.]